MNMMNSKPMWVAAAGFAVAVGATSMPANAAEYTAVPETSSVIFVASQQGSQFNGRFEEFTATVDFDPSKPEAGKIVGVVQVESVNSRDTDRDVALIEKDWFSAKEHPEARFESQSIEKTADGYRANGELTIKGKTNPVVMDFTFTPMSSASPGNAEFAGKMKVNRFDFNVGEGWNDTSMVGQDVNIEVKLDLKK